MNLLALRQKAKSRLITRRDFPVKIPVLFSTKTSDTVTYTESNHRYINTDKNLKMVSVTSFIDSLTKKEVDYPTASTELELGLTKEEVYLYWKQKSHWSKGRGSFIHNWIERELFLLSCTAYYKEIEIICNTLNEDFFTYRNFAKTRVKNKKYKVEELLYSVKDNIAGQADLIIDLDNKYFYIEDWKTNEKDLEVDDSYGECLFSNYPATTLQKYILQLTIYAYLYSLMTGKKCKGIHIHHFRNSKVTTYSYEYNPLLIEQLWQKELRLNLV